MTRIAAALALVLLAGSTARADVALGNLTRRDNQGALRYVWSRDGISLELRDRDAKWSEAEAIMVRDALDKLPRVYLKKAIVDAKVNRLYRDKLPRSPSGAKERAATTIARQGYMSVGDSLMIDQPERVYEVMTHELGHAVHYGLAGYVLYYTTGLPGWVNLSWTSYLTGGLKSWNGFVSDYARTDDHEDFAETAEFYWLAPTELLRVNPAKFRFMRDVVFEGLLSPLSARDPDKKAIDPVKPEITSLGDKSDTVGSHVTVHGNRFMGPWDGGFNEVRFRGVRGAHLAVSRKTVHAWVPPIGTGSAPVTVRTQDGTSNEAGFSVKKPWWKFW